jgi:hypothetical protein
MGREMMARIWEEKDKVLSPTQLTGEIDLFSACSRSLGPAHVHGMKFETRL